MRAHKSICALRTTAGARVFGKECRLELGCGSFFQIYCATSKRCCRQKTIYSSCYYEPTDSATVSTADKTVVCSAHMVFGRLRSDLFVGLGYLNQRKQLKGRKTC